MSADAGGYARWRARAGSRSRAGARTGRDRRAGARRERPVRRLEQAERRRRQRGGDVARDGDAAAAVLADAGERDARAMRARRASACRRARRRRRCSRPNNRSTASAAMLRTARASLAADGETLAGERATLSAARGEGVGRLRGRGRRAKARRGLLAERERRSGDRRRLTRCGNSGLCIATCRRCRATGRPGGAAMKLRRRPRVGRLGGSGARARANGRVGGARVGGVLRPELDVHDAAGGRPGDLARTDPLCDQRSAGGAAVRLAGDTRAAARARWCSSRGRCA